MQIINLTLADNGIIKSVIDDNINSAGEAYESTTVYELESNTENKIKFINELCLDAGIDFGNSKAKNQIQIKLGWGEHYQPTKAEIEEKIKSFNVQIKELETMLNKK